MGRAAPRPASRSAWAALRALGLGLPIVLVLGCAAAALRVAATSGTAAILGDTVLVAGLALVVSAPTALRLATWACRRGAVRRARALAIAASLPPVVLGVAVGSAFRLCPTETPLLGWACAVSATAAAMTPRIALELAGVARGARRTLIEAALALGASNRAAVRLALAGDEAVPAAFIRAAGAAVGDGVAALAALAALGLAPERPFTVGMALVAQVPAGTRGACALVILTVAVAGAIRPHRRWRLALEQRAGSARWGEPREALPSEGATYLAPEGREVPTGVGGRAGPPLKGVSA